MEEGRVEGRLLELYEEPGNSSKAASAIRAGKRGRDDVTGRLGMGNNVPLSKSAAMGTVTDSRPLAASLRRRNRKVLDERRICCPASL